MDQYDKNEQTTYKRVESEAEESGDEVKIRIPDRDSSDEADDMMESSNHVSTLKQTTFFEDSSRPQNREASDGPGLVLNETLLSKVTNKADATDPTAEDEDEQKDKPTAPVAGTKKDPKTPLPPGNVKTRRQKSKIDKWERILGAQVNSMEADEYDQNLAKLLDDQQKQTEILQKETFFGIKHLLEKDAETGKRPVILIIPNIKAFPPGVLNDLIHHLKVYRGSPHFLNLNLMLGV